MKHSAITIDQASPAPALAAPAGKPKIRKLKIIPDDKISSEVHVQAITVNSYTLGDNLILL